MKKIITLIVCVLSLILTLGCTKKTNSNTTTKKPVESSSITIKPTNGSSSTTKKNETTKALVDTTKKEETTTTKKSEPVYKVIDETHLLFGSYPQSLVEDDSLLSTLNSKYSNKNEWTSFEDYVYGVDEVDTYKYIDVVEGDNKYRGFSYEYARPYCIGDDSSYLKDYGYAEENGTYWFKWEPIKWTILNNSGNNKDDYLLVSELIIDAQNYELNDGKNTYEHGGDTGYASDYALSYIRNWLITSFYNTAFTESEKEIILAKTVNLTKLTLNNPDTNQFGSNEVIKDKVFLLSYADINNTHYFETSDDLFAEATDYTLVNGGSYYNEGSYHCYWLRSPEGEDTVTIVDAYSFTYGVNTLVINGIRPAIYIDITNN